MQRSIFAFILFCLFSITAANAQSTPCLDVKTAFNIVADGSDETPAILAAFAASETECVYFGKGIFAFDPTNLPTFDFVPMIETAGLPHTIFKNLSPTSRMFEFAKHVATDLNTSFLNLNGFQIDQNFSTGSAITAKAMFSKLCDIWVYNQRGAGWAFDIQTMTEGVLCNLLATNVTNCIKVTLTYYLNVDQFGCERTTGIGVLIESAASLNVRGLYLDNGSVPGVTAQELLKIVSSSTVNFEGFATEIGTGATLSPLAYFRFANSTNINFFGARVNHYAENNGSKYVFYSENSTLRIQGIEWVESRPAMILIGGTGNLVARDVVTSGTVSGSRYGIANWDGSATRVEVENWLNFGTPASNAYINAGTSYVRP